MKRTRLIAILCCICVSALVCATLISVVAFADGEQNRIMSVSGLKVVTAQQTIEGAYSDPVTYWEDSSNGNLVNYETRYPNIGAQDTVVYTAYYPKTTTTRVQDGIVEYACRPDGAKYYVTQINNSGDGTTYIPVGGFVVSVNSSVHPDFAKVGDEISVVGSKFKIPTKAVESDNGSRLVVDNTNTTRSGAMVVYYDYQFGAKTGTNIFGTEMTCVYDFEENTFKVKSFRGFLQGDDSGSEIPDNSFVLSAYGEGYRQLLVENQLFQKGNNVKMVGFDFIRFGGTVVGEYDFVNPTIEMNPAGMETETSPFPAYRGTNQTIIYKDGWSYEGSTGTGTNIYGFEAAVDANGVVVELNVNVSRIPQGGYVISGHGTGRDFVRSNMVLGATVVLNEENKTYSISTTLNSYYENLVTGVNSAISTAENRIKQLYDIDSVLLTEKIDYAKAQLASLKTVKEDIEENLDSPSLTESQRLSLLMNYNNYQVQIEKVQHQIVTLSAESKAVSARAVWHRPVEDSFAKIEETVLLYKEIGINMVFVETFYGGQSTFKTSVKDIPYNDRLGENYSTGHGTTYPDYLTAFTACCKAYGIEVHAWVENFYVGTQASIPLVKNHPDWILYNDNNTIVQRNEGGSYIFLDPANKEVQDMLIEYYLDLFAKVPDVVGLNLDYIRYPVSDIAEDTGYTEAAMKGFYEKTGRTFTTAQLATREKMSTAFQKLLNKGGKYHTQKEVDEVYSQWVDYRADIITGYVKRIKTEIKDEKGIMLSTSVFANFTESYKTKKQDWKTWFSNGWIDISTPMAYYNDATDVNLNVSEMILAAGNNCYYYAGLAASFSGLPAWQNKEQIEASHKAGANGYVIFCSTQILGHEDVQQALKDGVNSRAGVLPHAGMSEVLNGYFDAILDRADRIYIPAEGMTATQKQNLKAKMDEILEMPSDGAVNIYKIQRKVQSLVSGINSYAKGFSARRITEQLNELVSLLENKISIQLIADGDWIPEEGPRPLVTENGIVDAPASPGGQQTPVGPSGPQTPGAPHTPSGNEGGGLTPGAIVGIVLGSVAVLGGIAVAVVFIVKRKKAK